MNDRALFNVAASSLIIASTMVGCSGAALNNRVSESAGKIEQMAAAQARDAEQAIAKRDAGRAIEVAEAAVAADPRKADYRTLLGRAYLLGGRYDSARTAFEDALTLGSGDSRAIVNLALIHTARGREDAAREVLSRNIATLPAADYGLAMAMSGDTDEAIRILSQAIHDPAATARERQNLAYSYALAGRWTEARQMASFDLPPLDAARRVLGWAQMAQPGAESARVIAMIGVQPRGDDAGLPVRLALAPDTAPMGTPAPADPIRLAEAAAQPDSAPAAPVADIAIHTATAPTPVPLPESVDDAPLADVGRTLAATVREREEKTSVVAAEPAPAPFVQPKPASLLKVKIPAARPAMLTRAAVNNGFAPVDPGRGSAWVVQLGAFTSQQAAQASRAVYLKRHAALGGFPFVDSSAMVDGREYYRVAIAGFGDRAGADRLCTAIKAKGGACFVRMGGAEAAPTRWAQALKAMKPQQMAMR